MLVLVVLVAARLVLPLLVHLLMSGTDAVGPVDMTFLVITKWIDALLAMCFLGYFVFRQERPPAAFGLRTTKSLIQAAWVPITLCGALAAMIVGGLVLWVLLPEDQTRGELARRVEFMEVLPSDDLWLAALLFVAVAIHEEILFRGIILPGLRRMLGSWTAAVIGSSLLFAALHISQGTMAIPQIFLLSVVLSVCYVLSRSLPALIVVHFLFDFIIVAISPHIVDAVRAAEQAGAG